MNRVVLWVIAGVAALLIPLIVGGIMLMGLIGGAMTSLTNQQAAGIVAKQAEQAAAAGQGYCGVQLGNDVVVTTASQRDSVRTIIGIAKTMKMSTQAQIVATMVAQQESTLTNPANSGRNIRGFKGFPAPGAAFWLDVAKRSLNYPHTGVGNDADSVGMFQQRASAGWADVPGLVSARTQPDQAVQLLLNPRYATQAFFGGAGGPSNRGLSDVVGWELMAPTVAAQTVQGSAFGSAYARHEAMATQLVMANQDAPALPLAVPGAATLPSGAATSGSSTPGADASGLGSAAVACPPTVGVGDPAAPGDPGVPGSGPTVWPGSPLQEPSGFAAKLIAAGKPYLGTPYKWGGTGPRFDCSGYTQMMYRVGVGIELPRVAHAQWRATAKNTIPSLAAAKPGDLLFWGAGHKHHVALYIGGGKMMEAPRTGVNLRTTPVRTKGLTAITRVIPG